MLDFPGTLEDQASVEFFVFGWLSSSPGGRDTSPSNG